MKPITIDNLDLKDHVRWARDQVDLDPIYINEAQAVAQHPELLGTSTIYTSQWETLFDWQKRNAHWASFAPPLKYQLASKQLFSFRLFPTIYWDDNEEESDEEHEEDRNNEENAAEKESSQEQEKNTSINLFKQVINLPAFAGQPPILFEKDKTAILNLLESIKYIDKLLAQVSSRTMQYQKG